MEIIFDAYNASPESVLNAIYALCERRGEGACALVLGDMKELGTHTDAQNARIAAAIAKKKSTVDLLFLFGENASAVAKLAAEAGFPKAQIFENPNADRPEDTAREILNHKIDGMRVVIKGARGMQMERILHRLLEEREDDKNA